jgi:hypothetical protein
MLTLQYAELLPEITFTRSSLASPPPTSLHRGGPGSRSREGAAVIVRIATIGKGGPTGTFEQNEGELTR